MSKDDIRTRLLSELLVTNQEGVWQILGEDPNCDFGGSHHEPALATVQGSYATAVEFALDLPGFITWGGGGKIKKVEIIPVNRATLQQRMLLSSRRQTLKAELAEVDAELKKLGC